MFIYSVMDGSFRETRHLKDLLLVNLDFIQQQQELLSEKDKRIQHLQHENDTVRPASISESACCSDQQMTVQLHTHTHPFNGPFSGITQVSRYQKGKTSLDFTEARDSEWQWHQLGQMQVCTSLQTDNHASTPPLSFFTGRMPFLPPNQQHQSTEGTDGTVITE